MKERVKVDSYSVDADVRIKSGAKYGIVISHGAYNNMDMPLLKDLQDALSEYSTLRFNFSYTAQGKPTYGQEEKYAEEMRACVKRLGSKNIVLIGKSYGGALSLSISHEKELGIKKVIVLGLPLYPPGRPEEPYSLDYIKPSSVEMEFIIGESDDVCDLATFKRLLPEYKPHVIKNGDHSFAVKGDAEKTKKNWKTAIDLIKKLLSS